ncbi:DNA repair protein RAD51 homolog 3 isoform X1 [Diorhabda carinulata]|uniref:DNA repair protein RAD51 homolog 3 isoform X1 n=1 Tax=Diorhabda carinulata TaxID=1163345 RepID=UPI0025A035A9|nr:DNA repair protein RAD51 homolog 3 isoform X1 [Diorhabda carinulata]
MNGHKKFLFLHSFHNFQNLTKNVVNKNTYKSAFDIYKEELSNYCLLSYLENLDSILKNVLIPKRIIEFTGYSESTTIICLRFCISVQLPRNLGGLEKEAFYIDTTGNFSIEKVKDLASDFTKKYLDVGKFNVNSILKHIYYTKVNNFTQLMGCIFELELFLQGKNVSLIVVNSITFVLRCLEVRERFEAINEFFKQMSYLADKYNVIVIITNFPTTRINKNETYTTASLGDSFYHLVNSRISFTKIGSIFKAKLEKSLLHSECEVSFQI